MKILFSLGLMLLAAGSVFAETEEMMTRDLYVLCGSKVEAERARCDAYFSGVVDAGLPEGKCYDMESEIPVWTTPMKAAFMTYAKNMASDTGGEPDDYAIEAILNAVAKAYPCDKNVTKR